MTNIAHLLISCPDRPGIIAAVTTFLHNQGANVLELHQHATATAGGTFFMRLAFSTPDGDDQLKAMERAFTDVVAKPLSMSWQLRQTRDVVRTAVLVSRRDHALMELLWLWQQDHLPTEIAMVVSNHDDLRSAVEPFGVPYHHIDNRRAIRAEAEARMRDLFKAEDIGLLVLARYMQILSPEMVAAYQNRIINIHHSFLPAFAGARPYHQAHERGVKIIGATAHYVTAELDEGPIIEQDVARVHHGMSIAELVHLGRNIEREVLARAVRWHLEDRCIVDGNKVIVFNTA